MTRSSPNRDSEPYAADRAAGQAALDDRHRARHGTGRESRIAGASARADDGHRSVPAAVSGRRGQRNSFAFWVRWLHIYLSMFGFAALLFFAVTGLTVNHPDWVFGNSERVTQFEGELPASLLRPPVANRSMSSADPGADQGDSRGRDNAAAVDPDFGTAARDQPVGDDEASGVDSLDSSVEPVDRLGIVEQLRAAHSVRGAVSDFSADEYQIVVVFKGPAYSADAFIDRETGHYQLTVARRGFIAVMNDLHKGRDTGRAWSWVIDISAVLMILVSVTGLVLIFYLKRRLATGLIVGAVGLTLVVAAFWSFVP